MIDYYTDGHYIAANSPQDARDECRALYGHTPEIVRPWDTDTDTEETES